MNAAQTIFALFFAIFWGLLASVQGRWLAFQPVLTSRQVRWRWVHSFTFLNVLPALYFSWTVYQLKGGPTFESLGAFATVREVFGAIMAAFAMFAFYRLWMAVVQSMPEHFYQRAQEQDQELKGLDPTFEELKLGHELGGWNLLSAAIYIVIGFLGPVWIR